MRRSTKAMTFLTFASLFFPSFLESSTVYAQRQSPEANTFYFDGSRWIPSWIQCDLAAEVVVVLGPPPARLHKYLAFPKTQPSAVKMGDLVQQGEAESAMGGKTLWTFTPSDAGEQIYAILESNYSEVTEHRASHWTRKYQIGTGPDESTAINKKQECRWFPRTRAALITDQASIYVTETLSGQLVLTSYEYWQGRNHPSVTLGRGTSQRDNAAQTESFLFKKMPYTYVVTVGLPEQPTAQFSVMKNGMVIRKDAGLAFSYTRKP